MELIAQIERFAYRDRRYLYDSECGLGIYGDKDRKNFVVIATELKDNPGASITNSYETIAGVVYSQFIAPFNVDRTTRVSVKWVEHYPAGHYRFETFDTVEMDMSYIAHLKTFSFTAPIWRSLSRRDLESLIGNSLRGAMPHG